MKVGFVNRYFRGVLKQAGLAATDTGVSSYARTLADLYVMGENSYYEQYRILQGAGLK
ncbi:hypothetical protein [Christensenella tenuis]|jgi:hypothetical protein|uniref:Uncharacterized protein n=1 Tax=Christensenella tenuis TaxID=2763033 RepID=A0ABR7EFU5_9FIRM|nr:hypothetical protein [Christensenella tenuis]MBC5648261.1 hypothetical protein [Christensenella tenuis]